MAMTDAKGRMHRLWGGYSPKVYDSDFLELFKPWFEKN